MTDRQLRRYSGEDQVQQADLTDFAKFDEAEFGSKAWRGEATNSNVTLRDETGRFGNQDDLPGSAGAPISLASKNVVRYIHGSNILWQGRIANKSWKRGEQAAGRAREVELYLEDVNIDLRGVVVHHWVRPEEDDVTRMQALVADYLAGDPSPTRHLNYTTYVNNSSNLVTLSENIYNQSTAIEVMEQIAAEANKTFWLWPPRNTTEAATRSGFLVYDGNDAVIEQCPFRITDREDEIRESPSTRFYPIWNVGPAEQEDGQNLLSGVYYFYTPTDYVHVSDATQAAIHAHWEEVVSDDSVGTEAAATKRANAILSHRKYENRTVNVTIGPLTDEQIGSIRVGQMISIKARALPDADDGYKAKRIAQLKFTTPVPGTWFVHLMLERPVRMTAYGTGGKPAPKPPTQPTAGNSVRLYHSAHTAGSGSTAESLASPNLTSGDIAAGWEYDSGGAFEYYQLYDAPAASTVGTGVAWSATDAAAGQAVLRGYVKELDGDLLAVIQNGGTVHMQARARSRYGTGISEGSQNNTSYWTIRVYRPGSSSFIGTPVAMNIGGSSAWPAQETYVNRFWSATLTAVPGAVAGDYLVIDAGTNHTSPTSGGTGATILFEDRFADDLPEDEINTGSRNSWVEFTGSATGDSTSPTTNPGEESPGTDTGTYSPIDHSHSHGLLAEDGVHMHDASQIDGLTEDEVGSALDATMVRLLGGDGYLYAVHRDNAGDYQIYLLAGYDGADFDTVIGPEPLFTPTTTGAEARDGGLIRWRDKFYVAHTGGTAGSGNFRFTVYVMGDDLSTATLVASHSISGSVPGATAVWAPKFFRDPEQSIDTLPYMLLAVADGGTTGSPSSFAPMYVQYTADDLSTISAATAITGTGFPAESIDPWIAYIPEMGTAGSPYKLFLVDDGAAKTVGVWESASPFSGYVVLDSDLAWSATDHEAPVVIDMGDGRWRGYYNKHSGFDSLGAFYRDWTPDGGWGSEVAVSTPWLEAHGTVLRLADRFEPVATSGASALDDLTDVTVSSPAEDEQLQYISGEWVNNSRRWEPVVTDPGTGPELVFDGSGDVVMTWVEY